MCKIKIIYYICLRFYRSFSLTIYFNYFYLNELNQWTVKRYWKLDKRGFKQALVTNKINHENDREEQRRRSIFKTSKAKIMVRKTKCLPNFARAFSRLKGWIHISQIILKRINKSSAINFYPFFRKFSKFVTKQRENRDHNSIIPNDFIHSCFCWSWLYSKKYCRLK